MSLRVLKSGGTNGAFFESQNEAANHPEVVARMAKPLLEWHRAIGPMHPNMTDAQMARHGRGCEAFPFPGIDRV